MGRLPAQEGPVSRLSAIAFIFRFLRLRPLDMANVVLRPPWRVIGACMAINGLLMFGCSTAFSS